MQYCLPATSDPCGIDTPVNIAVVLFSQNGMLNLYLNCSEIDIFISHDMLPSDLVAQSVEHRWSNPKVVGSIPTLVRVFLCPCAGPIPSVGLMLVYG